MSEETSKQLLFGAGIAYFILCFAFVMVGFLNGAPVEAIMHGSAPVLLKIAIVLLWLVSLPGMIAIDLFLIALIPASVVGLPVWLVGSSILGRPMFPKQIDRVTRGAKQVVEFFAWLSFMFGKAGRIAPKPEVPKGCVDCGARVDWAREAFCTNCGSTLSETAGRETMADPGELLFIKTEIAELRKRYPELPAFHQNSYDGWFSEALKRYEMQSYNRTQEQRVEVLKKIAELNGLYLTIARQMGEKSTFEQEQRIRTKRMSVEEIKLDQELAELQHPKSTRERKYENFLHQIFHDRKSESDRQKTRAEAALWDAKTKNELLKRVDSETSLTEEEKNRLRELIRREYGEEQTGSGIYASDEP